MKPTVDTQILYGLLHEYCRSGISQKTCGPAPKQSFKKSTIDLIPLSSMIFKDSLHVKWWKELRGRKPQDMPHLVMHIGRKLMHLHFEKPVNGMFFIWLRGSISNMLFLFYILQLPLKRMSSYWKRRQHKMFRNKE